MELDFNSCYQALLTHDVRFDGAFFVAVSTTGIYCRTVCMARTPRPENCTFHRSAAAAERAGFRPCFRCRPECAPGNAHIDSINRLAAAAAARIEDGALHDRSIADLAAELHVSDRHLRRAVETEFGISPVELAQSHRLHLARRLLVDSDLPIAEVAFASGFSSLRRFNALFKERYGSTPGEFRTARSHKAASETLTGEIAYQAPFDLDSLLGFLTLRTSSGVEAVEGARYLRTVRLGKHQGWVVVQPAVSKAVMRVELSASLTPVLPAVFARVKRLFDLGSNTGLIAERLGELAAPHPGLRVPGAFDGFEMAVRAILGQQISVKAATTLARRFAAAFGEPIETPFPELTRLSPSADRMAGSELDQLCELGITSARGKSILALAKAVAEGGIKLEPGVDIERTMAKLKELPGIGEWTAQYIAMRALSWPDAFPHTDLGIYRALGESNPKRVLERAEAWRPWRSYAAMHLWKGLG